MYDCRARGNDNNIIRDNNRIVWHYVVLLYFYSSSSGTQPARVSPLLFTHVYHRTLMTVILLTRFAHLFISVHPFASSAPRRGDGRIRDFGKKKSSADRARHRAVINIPLPVDKHARGRCEIFSSRREREPLGLRVSVGAHERMSFQIIIASYYRRTSSTENAGPGCWCPPRPSDTGYL